MLQPIGRLVSNKNKPIETKIANSLTSDYSINRIQRRGPAFNDKVLSGLQANPQVLPDYCFYWSDAAGQFIDDEMSLSWKELIAFATPSPHAPAAAYWDNVKAYVKRESPSAPVSDRDSRDLPNTLSRDMSLPLPYILNSSHPPVCLPCRPHQGRRSSGGRGRRPAHGGGIGGGCSSC